jgi:hypothetical protein
MNKIEFNSDRTAAIVQTAKVSALVTFKNAPRATASVPTLNENRTSEKLAYWGETSNDLPQKMISDIRKDVELGPWLNTKAVLTYAGGLTWGIPKMVQKGEEYIEVLTPLTDPKQEREIKDFMRKSAIPRYLYEASVDLRTFFNGFAEFVLQVDHKKIVQLCIQAAETCRWEKMNSSGVIEHCYINANFPDESDLSKAKKVKVLDPYYDPAARLKELAEKDKERHNYIYPLSIPTPGSTYYQHPDWNGVREVGWLEVSQAIPKFKQSVLENQMAIKYHVEISDQFWPTRFPDWEEKTAAQKETCVQAELKKFSDIMSGVEGAGNSLITAMKQNFEQGKDFSMWKITPIENKLSKGEFMAEVKEASINKAMAVGLHPALLGTVPNSGLGGSGSNIREAFNLNAIVNKPVQDIILEPLYVIRDFNKWNPDVEFRIKNPFMTTLDKGVETETKTE